MPVIDRIIELQPARIFEVGDFTYIDKDKTVTRFEPPVPSTITVATLSGFVSLLENGFEGYGNADALVQVTAFDEVKLINKTSDKYGRRQTFAIAKAMKTERNFRFNEFIPQEEFNIALLSMFVETTALSDFLAITGNIAKETEVRQQDDGMSQQVQSRAGVVLKRDITVKPRVTLQPFRTFTEVDQPVGDFIFRVRHDERLGNLCALFEADAGAWKLTAMNTIKTWLQNRLRTSDRAAVNTLPVIA